MGKNKLRLFYNLKLKEILFKKFCRISDALLLDKNATKTTIAIRSLHIIKNHPDYLYTTNNKSFFLILKYIINNFFFAILYNLRFRSDKKKIKFKNKSTILISHLVNKDFIYKKNDFYYGNLQQIFKRKKISSFKIFCNHTNTSSRLINKNLAKKNIIIFEKYLDLKSEYHLFKEQLFEFFRLIKIFKNTKNLFKKKVLKQALISLFDKETLFALKTSHQLDFYLQKLNPKTLICTYEGYSWERLCFQRAKSFSKKIICIGYQHTPVINSNYSIKRNIQRNYDPDIIWCTSKQSFKQIKNSKKIIKNSAYHLGNLKNINQKKTPMNKINKNKLSFLVIPEGTISECTNLFNFSIKSAFKKRSFKFVLRTHPIIDIDKIFKILKIEKKKLPKNVIISKNKNILQDIKRTSFVLFRGSAAVLQSILAGNIPIYLKIIDDKNINPIQEFKNEIKTVSNFKELDKLSKSYISKKQINLKLIENIKKNYYKEFNINKLIKIKNKIR